MKKISESNLSYLLELIATSTKQLFDEATPPTATTSEFGLVKPDGTTITVNNNGVISVSNVTVPVATSSTNGIFKPDDTTIGLKDTSKLYVKLNAVDPDPNIPPDGLIKPQEWFIEEEEDDSLESNMPYLYRIYITPDDDIYGLCLSKQYTDLNDLQTKRTMGGESNPYYTCYISKFSNGQWDESNSNDYEKVYYNLWNDWFVSDEENSFGFYSVAEENYGDTVSSSYFSKPSGGADISVDNSRRVYIVNNKFEYNYPVSVYLPSSPNYSNGNSHLSFWHTNQYNSTTGSIRPIIGFITNYNSEDKGMGYNYSSQISVSTKWQTYQPFTITTNHTARSHNMYLHHVYRINTENNSYVFHLSRDYGHLLLNFDDSNLYTDITSQVKIKGNGNTYQNESGYKQLIQKMTIKVYNQTLYAYVSDSQITNGFYKYDITNKEWNLIASTENAEGGLSFINFDDIDNGRAIKSMNDFAINNSDEVHVICENGSGTQYSYVMNVEHWYFDGSDWTKLGQCIPELWKATE